jgi:hypothetical protein
MVWGRWLKYTHLKGSWTVDGSEALQWPGLGRRLSHGAPPWHVAAMSRTDTKGAGPKGSHSFVSFPPSHFLSLFPPHFLLFSPPLQAPPVFLCFVCGSAAAFQSAASGRIRFQHLRRSVLKIPSSLFTIFYSLRPNLYSLILYALIHSFSSLILLFFHFVVHWVSSEWSTCFRVHFSFKVHAF